MSKNFSISMNTGVGSIVTVEESFDKQLIISGVMNSELNSIKRQSILFSKEAVKTLIKCLEKWEENNQTEE